MATENFVRPPKVDGPPPPKPQVLELAAPDEMPRAVPMSKIRMAFPIVMVVAVVGMLAMMVHQSTSGGAPFSPMYAIFPIMMLGSMIGMFSAPGGGKKTAEVNEDRRDYLVHIATSREQVLDVERQHFDYNAFWFPNPKLLAAAANSKRLWSLSQSSSLALTTRVALGRVNSPANIHGHEPKGGPAELLDPLELVVVSKFIKAHTTISDVPIKIQAKEFPAIGAAGDRDRALGMVRAMVAHLAVFNGPDFMKVVVVADPDRLHLWDWVKWLPHNQHDSAVDGVGSARMVYSSIAEMDASVGYLGGRKPYTGSDFSKDAYPYLLIVHDCDDVNTRSTARGFEGVCWLQLGASGGSLAAQSGSIYSVTEAGECTQTSISDRARRRKTIGKADYLSTEEATAAARRMARHRIGTLADQISADENSGDIDTSWASLVGIRDVGDMNPDQLWRPHHPQDKSRLAFPIGHDEDNRPVILDIKEPAQGGKGPHGICIGTTSSGKSEMLRAVVLSAAATHSPDDLNMVLSDFKGGTAFEGMEVLNHVTAVITNLKSERDQVLRLKEVFASEVERREHQLRDEGRRVRGHGFKDVAEYNEARLAGADLAPLPALLIVVDEYTEMLVQFPEFADVFTMIGRVGRGLWMHMLLATQTFDTSKTRGVEGNLSYKLALRTETATESRNLLGSPIAYQLPRDPGAAYLVVGQEITRFQGAFTGARYYPRSDDNDSDLFDDDELLPPPVHGARLALFSAGWVPPEHYETPTADSTSADSSGLVESSADAPAVPAGSRVTVYSKVLDRMAGHGNQAHPMWLPPLNTTIALGDLVAAAMPTWHSEVRHDLQFPLAIVDNPKEQQQAVMSIDTGSGGANLSVVGSGQTGKSTALISLIASAAMTHDPELVQFYCMDFSGGLLSAVMDLPNVGIVAQTDEARSRTFGMVLALLKSRQELFATQNIIGSAQFREMKARRDPRVWETDRYGEVYLVIDGVELAVNANNGLFADRMAELEEIAQAGPNVGIHLVVTAQSWMGMRAQALKSAGSRIELRLTSPEDSVLARGMGGIAKDIPEIPGRGVSSMAPNLHLKVAAPQLVHSGVAALADDINEIRQILERKYGGRRAPRLDLLPKNVSIEQVRDSLWVPADPAASRLSRLKVPFGVYESDLSAATVDFMSSPHMHIYGSAQSGKSTTMSSLARSIRSQLSEEEAWFLFIDYRRTHYELGRALVANPAYYIDGPEGLPVAVELIQQLMGGRTPPKDIDPERIQRRDWFSGPDLFVFIDDYQLVDDKMARPFEALRPLIGRGGDRGVHIVVSRSIQNASMAITDPVIGPVRQANSSGLLLDGNRNDGGLIDEVTKPRPQPVHGRGFWIQPTSSRPTEMIQVAYAPTNQMES